MKKIAFGLVLIAAGVVFMLDKMNLISPDITHWLFTWQMLLIAIGFVNIFSRDSFIAGVILIMIGTFFLVPEIITFPFNFLSMFWPLLLVAAGVLLIAKHSIRYLNGDDQKKKWDNFQQRDTPEGYFEEVNIFSGSKRIVTNEFKGGSFVNVFGGSELDLTHARLDGEVVIIEAICVFGGFTLIVPSDWEVRIEAVSIFGAIPDKRNFIRTSATDPRKLLVVKGVCVFGGGEVKAFK